MLSIDRIHCPIDEPTPWSPIWSSHKLDGKPAANYELGILIHESKLAWVQGPSPPGLKNDLSVFREALKYALPAGKRCFGDKGYRGEPDYISTQNEHDIREVAEFKERVLSRHKNFNQRLKCFNILKNRFRHNIEQHKAAFESVCAIVMYELESGGTSLLEPYP